jgi:uncharacterized protein (TIRG00374 family)
MAKPNEDDMPQPSATRAWRGHAIRIVIGVALLTLLYDWHVIDVGALRVLWERPGMLALALAMALANIPLEGWRWHVLLRAQGLDLRPLRTMRVLASSIFFANFLPGAAGGDLIRGVYVYKAARGRRAPALLSILIDRLLGLIAFVLIGLFALLTRPALEGRLFVAALIAVSALFILLLAILFLFGDRLARTLQRLTARRSTRLTRIVGDTGMALRQYGKDWRSTGLALLLSAVIVGLAVGPIVLIATAMPFTGPSAIDYGIAGLYALIANSLPITPGGIGIGEGAFASACVMLAPTAMRAAYGTIFLAFRCVFILSTLPGLALYLIDA